MNKYLMLFTIIFAFLFFSPTAKSQSLLWEISGNGLEESSYLFGTVHLSDQRVFNFNDSVFAKIDECDAFTMEIEATPENTKKIGTSIYLEDGKTIDKMLSEKDYVYLTKFFKETFDLNLDGLKIFTPMTIISMATMKLFKSDMDTYVDNFLYQYAKSKNKITFSVEPVQLQIDLLKTVPAEYLLDVANEWDNYQGISEKMVHAYAKEDLDALIKIIFSDSGFKKMEDEFIWDRNITMVDSIDLFINRQSTFIAIGTAHLPLEGGVIDLLQKKGYEVKPIIAPKTRALPEIKKNENWVTVAPKEAGFSMRMPKQPELNEFDQASDFGNLKLKLYMVEMPNENENMAYGIAITDYPADIINSDSMTQSELYEYYEQSLLGGANAVSGVPIERGEIQWDSHLAKTMDVDAYSGSVKIRYAVLLKKNRLYLAQVISKGSLENNHNLKKFFNSFKLENYDLEKSENTPSKEWETLVSEEGNFSISMLGKTVGKHHNSNGEAPKNSDPLYFMSENLDIEGREFVQYIMYADFEDGLNADSMSKEELIEFYDENLTTTIESIEGELISKKEVTIENHLAQKSEITMMEDGVEINLMAIRLLDKNRFYYLQFLGEKDVVLDEKLTKFLNSFKILKK